MITIEGLLERHPLLTGCRADIEAAAQLMHQCFAGGGKLLVCGNGGSAADADHMVAELMKGFLSPRPLGADLRARLTAADPAIGPVLAARLQGALPAVNLAAHSALLSAFGNDVDAHLAYAQAVQGYGRPGDLLVGISTSGNADDVIAALCAARAIGMKIVGLSGRDGGRMNGKCDALIRVPADAVHEVQELHVPVYHYLCAAVEARFW